MEREAHDIHAAVMTYRWRLKPRGNMGAPRKIRKRAQNGVPDHPEIKRLGTGKVDKVTEKRPGWWEEEREGVVNGEKVCGL